MSGNRVYVSVMIALAVLLGVGSAVLGKKPPSEEPPPPPPDLARAVDIPTDDATRRVVVPPCSTDPAETRKNAERGVATPGTVDISVPKGTGPRTVVVPDCNKQTGAATAEGVVSAIAYVLPQGAKHDKLENPRIGFYGQVIVPPQSPAEVIVVPPCTRRIGGPGGRPSPQVQGQQGQDIVINPEPPGSKTAEAPTC